MLAGSPRRLWACHSIGNGLPFRLVANLDPWMRPARSRTSKGTPPQNRIGIVRHAWQRMAERGAQYQDVRHARAGARRCKAADQGRWKTRAYNRSADPSGDLVPVARYRTTPCSTASGMAFRAPAGRGDFGTAALGRAAPGTAARLKGPCHL